MAGIVELAEPPGLARLYARAALRLRRSGQELPDTTLVLRDVRVDREQLAGYARVCGYRLTDELPPTYPHVLAFPLTMAVLTAPEFPFPAVGLVHIANRIETRRPVCADEPLELTVRPADLREHERGRCVDIRATASVGDEVVWREVSTYLRKERPAGSGSGGAAPAPAPAASGALWHVGREVARSYARVSGDRNPIHTSRLAARAFGYPGPIAHGMWSAARCLAALEGRLPDRYAVDMTFRRPIVLPATVCFAGTPGVERWTIGLHDAKSGVAHLTGAVTG
jgi:MaoC dehydratase-like protein